MIYKRRDGKTQTFVLATPISGPAFIWTPQSVNREIELPTVFVIPTVKEPRVLQYCKAINVSAVSPDWLSIQEMILSWKYWSDKFVFGLVEIWKLLKATFLWV